MFTWQEWFTDPHNFLRRRRRRSALFPTSKWLKYVEITSIDWTKTLNYVEITSIDWTKTLNYVEITSFDWTKTMKYVEVKETEVK